MKHAGYEITAIANCYLFAGKYVCVWCVAGVYLFGQRRGPATLCPGDWESGAGCSCAAIQVLTSLLSDLDLGLCDIVISVDESACNVLMIHWCYSGG